MGEPFFAPYRCPAVGQRPVKMTFAFCKMKERIHKTVMVISILPMVLFCITVLWKMSEVAYSFIHRAGDRDASKLAGTMLYEQFCTPDDFLFFLNWIAPLTFIGLILFSCFAFIKQFSRTAIILLWLLFANCLCGALLLACTAYYMFEHPELLRTQIWWL